MKLFIIISLTITLIQLTKCQYISDDYDDEEIAKPIYDINKAPELFEKFIKDFNKKYENDNEHKVRFNYFLNNVKEINKINSDITNTYGADINKFSDFSPEERKSLFGAIPDEPDSGSESKDVAKDSTVQNNPPGSTYGDDARSFDNDNTQGVKKPTYDLKEAPRLFRDFIKKFNKKYPNKEVEEERYKIFLENLKEINMINKIKDYSTTVDINLFSDYTRLERFDTFGLNF